MAGDALCLGLAGGLILPGRMIQALLRVRLSRVLGSGLAEG